MRLSALASMLLALLAGCGSNGQHSPTGPVQASQDLTQSGPTRDPAEPHAVFSAPKTTGGLTAARAIVPQASEANQESRPACDYIPLETESLSAHLADANLARLVQALVAPGDSVLYKAAVAAIETLDASGQDIERLDGIEALANLRWLSLADNQIVDLAPLTGLEQLTEAWS